LIRFACVLGLALTAAAAITAFAPQSRAAGTERPAVQLEARIAARVNGVRGWYGLRPLRHSSGLQAAARSHSWDMVRQGFFEHDSANGLPFWRRIARFYRSRGFARWQVGENLLWSSRNVTAVQIVGRWMRSPGHRANLLSGAWRELGVGALRRAHRGHTVTIVTLDFGARAR
jgi:uncharacterized protein YkwD